MTGSARWRLAGIGVCVLVAALGGVFLFARDSVTSTLRFADRQLVRVGNESPATDARPDAVDPIAEPDEIASPERTPSAGLRISGHLVSADGKPLRNVRVRAYRANGDRLADAKSRSDGGVTVRNLPHDEPVFLRVEEDRYWSVPESPEDGRFELASVDMTDMQIILGRGATISGIVERTNGYPLPAAEIFVRRIDDLKQVQRVARADEHGLFESRPLPSGDYEFVFRREDEYVVQLPEAQRIHIENDKPLRDLWIVYPDSALFAQMISGVVTDSSGTPVLSAKIFSENYDYYIAVTDNQGKFFANLNTTVKTIVARHQYYSDSLTQEVEPGEVHVNITLPPPATVEGQVVDARNGRPVRDYRVRVGSGNGVDEDFAIVHDDEGRFSVKHVKAGSASVSVVARGYADSSTSIGQLAPGETRRGVQVRLPIGAEIEGRVLDQSGAPVRLARVHFEPVGGQQVLINRRATDTTGDDGYFYLQSVPLGAIKFVAEHEAYATVSINVNVVPGGANDLRIIMETGGRIRGLVTVGGKPTSTRGRVSVKSASLAEKYATIGDDGRFTIGGLAYGVCSVSISVDSDRSELQLSRSVEIKTGETTEIRVDLPGLTARVRGVVRSPKDSPLDPRLNAIDPRTSLVASYVSADGELVGLRPPLGSDGSFDFQVPPGPIRLSAFAGAGAKYVMVEAAANKTVNQDVRFDLGSNLYVDVHKDPKTSIQILVFRGSVLIDKVTDELMKSLWDSLAGAAGRISADGQATIPAVEPGTYTVVATEFEYSPETREQTYGRSAKKTEFEYSPETREQTYGRSAKKTVQIGSEDEVVELNVRE